MTSSRAATGNGTGFPGRRRPHPAADSFDCRLLRREQWSPHCCPGGPVLPPCAIFPGHGTVTPRGLARDRPGRGCRGDPRQDVRRRESDKGTPVPWRSTARQRGGDCWMLRKLSIAFAPSADRLIGGRFRRSPTTSSLESRSGPKAARRGFVVGPRIRLTSVDAVACRMALGGPQSAARARRKQRLANADAGASAEFRRRGGSITTVRRSS